MINDLVKLKDYVPLFQTIIWIGFIIIFFLIFKKPIHEIVSTLIDRIKKGSSIKAGPLEIGAELRGMAYAEQTSSDSKVSTGSDGDLRENHRIKIYERNKGLFLTHIIVPSDKVGQLYDIFIYLTRHKSIDFSDIEKAEFFFGHMWGNQVFTERQKNGIIGISTSAYAPFLCTCCVRLKNGDEIQLDRYIDFEMKKIYKELN
jgi:hypothetical protein